MIKVDINFDEVLDILKNDIGNCLYMYIDIYKYRNTNPEVVTWVNDGKIKCVVLKYYNSVQIYAQRSKMQDTDYEDIVELLKGMGVKMISMPKELIENRAFETYISENYEKTCGKVLRFTNYADISDSSICIERAAIDDMREIAELLCSDEEFASNYECDNLERQLTERYLDSMGRNLVVRKNRKIVGHIATYAEVDNIAITSGLIVEKEHRDSLIGLLMERELVEQLLDEGKEVYTFVKTKNREKFLVKIGNEICGEYVTLTNKEA